MNHSYRDLYIKQDFVRLFLIILIFTLITLTVSGFDGPMGVGFSDSNELKPMPPLYESIAGSLPSIVKATLYSLLYSAFIILFELFLIYKLVQYEKNRGDFIPDREWNSLNFVPAFIFGSAGLGLLICSYVILYFVFFRNGFTLFAISITSIYGIPLFFLTLLAFSLSYIAIKNIVAKRMELYFVLASIFIIIFLVVSLFSSYGWLIVIPIIVLIGWVWSGIIFSRILKNRNRSDYINNKTEETLIFAEKYEGIPKFPLPLISNYHDLLYITKGGVAAVWRGRRNSDNKEIAIKVPLKRDSLTGKSFMNEIRVWESLVHKNIVPVLNANILPVPYVEMEYMPHSLSDCMYSLTTEQKQGIICGVLEGLSYAHEKGISHLDLKPANILLSNNFEPKIADWGLSVSKRQIYSHGLKGFSYPYIAPEQKEPLTFGPLGPWTDVYIVGLLIREIFMSERPENTYHYSETISETISGTSVELTEIIHICLNQSPKSRYCDASSLLKALNKWLNTSG